MARHNDGSLRLTDDPDTPLKSRRDFKREERSAAEWIAECRERVQMNQSHVPPVEQRPTRRKRKRKS
jgi:hypothetical protein